ncbi:MAG: ABC transporter substrate-binding protein [Clostridia bacterium]|nr:ABC transporter substrate-binding protein [Clostridia bacterium]
MKHIWFRPALALLLALCLVLPLFGCSDTDTASDNIVNIGMTDTIPSVNPLLLDASEIGKTICDFQFLQLCELDSNLEFVGMLADSITTEDNIHFTVHIDEAAVWSDGTPVTADDLVFSVLRYASPVIGNTSMLLYVFEGVDPNTGFVAEGATAEDLTGVVATDDKTVVFTARQAMPLASFMNTYGRYIHVIPEHILGDVPESELSSYAWFDAPEVVSGPYRIVDYDRNHYVSFVANDQYFKGAPKIEKLNIKIVEPSQQYAGLRSGEIDFIQQTTGNIPNEDYSNVQALEGITTVLGSPVTNQSVFIQTANVTDVRIRQAILHAIDREALVSGLLGGNGEVVDGFLSSASPYYDDSIVAVTRDVEKAKALVAEAVADGWDADYELKFYVTSSDSVFVNAASYIKSQLEEVGLKVKIVTVDFSTLMTVAGTLDYDLLAVQYTYSPVDPYPDMAWLLGGEGSWTGYANDEVNAALTASQATDDVAQIRAAYSTVNRLTQQEVPMFSAYIIRALGAVNDRVKGARPDVFGSYINIHEWEIQ